MTGPDDELPPDGWFDMVPAEIKSCLAVTGWVIVGAILLLAALAMHLGNKISFD